MTEFVDPASRLEALILKMEPRFRSRFLEVVKSIKDQTSLVTLSELIQAGRMDEVLQVVETVGLRMSSTFNEVMAISGQQTAQGIAANLNVLIDFNQINQGALSVMQSNQLRLVNSFAAEQRAATREALIDGIRRGANPLDQARAFRGSIGLTRYQQQIVNNYRRNLEQLSARALSRQLRDARFDRTVGRAIRDGQPLSPDQIERMVGRYQDRWVKYRSEVIARTESLRSVHAGNREMYRQAVEAGTLLDTDLVREWNTSQLPNVRDSHEFMHGQRRKGMDEPFVSGAGNALLMPGDSSAPPEETAQCVCAVTTRYTDAARVAA